MDGARRMGSAARSHRPRGGFHRSALKGGLGVNHNGLRILRPIPLSGVRISPGALTRLSVNTYRNLVQSVGAEMTLMEALTKDERSFIERECVIICGAEHRLELGLELLIQFLLAPSGKLNHPTEAASRAVPKGSGIQRLPYPIAAEAGCQGHGSNLKSRH